LNPSAANQFFAYVGGRIQECNGALRLRALTPLFTLRDEGGAAMRIVQKKNSKKTLRYLTDQVARLRKETFREILKQVILFLLAFGIRV